MRPYTIIHFIASVDGRISGDQFLLDGMKPIHEANFRYRYTYDADAVLNGTTTCAEIYSDGFVSDTETNKPEEAVSGDNRYNDNILFKEGDKTVICIDPEGRLNWKQNYVDRDVMPVSHVVEILTKQVRKSYVDHLDELGISYIFAGESKIDLKLMMEKLYEYGIRKILVTGGGAIDYALLGAGLIDEITAVISPIISGDRSKATGFDITDRETKGYDKMLKLKSFEELKDGSLRITYLTGEKR